MIDMAARRQVTNKLRTQYRKASNADKSKVLDRVVATTGMGLLNRPRFYAHFLCWKDGAMSIRYDENTKARAVRLVREHRDDYDSEWAAMKAISGRLGMNPETR